ncbi:MAG: Uma2 family endonuclease [Chloroflexota bacterium]
MVDQVRTGVSITEWMRPEYERTEVVNGVLVEVDTDMMGLLHTIIIDNLILILKPFAKQHKLGLVHTDGVKYILYVDENGIQTAYKPDLAFLRNGRIPVGFDLYRDPFPGAPDLAVEIISPGQTTADMLEKAADYLRYGTEEVWIIYPMKRQLHRYRGGEEVPEVYAGDTIFHPEALFPGLSLKVADLFIVEES